MRWLWRQGGKRLFDVALACFGLLVFSLPVAWIAWRIRREAGSPVLFGQDRIGRDGKIFRIWKFRTMASDGEITSLGKGLRATAMDELPQLIHILKGEMSFVGPRPLIPADLEELNRSPQGRLRLAIRPGLTGLAQVSTSKVPSLPDRLRWDLEYVERCSPWLDAWVLAQSLWFTLRGQWEKPSA